MNARVRLAVVVSLAGLFGPVTGQEVHAAEPRLVRVVLLRVADRMSLALEMTGEPQKAALRILSTRAVELEAGPVSGLFREEQLAPDSNVSFIRQVSIQKYTTNRAAFVRARVTFDVPGAGNVRVVGRTVYVDFAPTTTTLRPQVVPAPRFDRRREATEAPAVTRAQPSSPANSLSANSYEQEVRPLLARLTEIGPFLTSAAAAPADDVLQAVGGTLAQVEQQLRTMNVPQASRPAHNVLLSTVATAKGAVASDFRGDRVVQAQRALALLDAVKSEIR